MKHIEKESARNLRQEGKSIKTIAKLLKVSPSSVSLWVRDIVLNQEQINILQENNAIYDRQHKGAQARKQNAYILRKSYQEAGKLKAKVKSPLHMAGCMLYWAEGAKSRTSCKFTNSDPNMLKMFLEFLYKEYDIKQEQIRIHINCYTTNGITVTEIENYWAKTLSLPNTCFNKSTTDNISKYSQQKKTKNKLLYGTVNITVGSVELLQNIYGAIQEYAGFDNEFCIH